MLRNKLANRLGPVAGFLSICLLTQLVPYLVAQTPGMVTAVGTLRGTVTDASGKLIANATVTATNAENSQPTLATTGTDGSYHFENLPAGAYQLKFEADGFKTLEIPSAKITGSEGVVLDEKLETGEQMNGAVASTQRDNLPNAPSSNATSPSLADLGLSTEQTQGNAREQALLDKRTHMLKIHQRMGLITTIPLIATVVTSLNAGGKNTSSTSRDLHTALGGLTGDLYGITAYYAIRAPRVQGTETRGPIRFHKAMAWIHGPGMILTPILGIMAFDEKNKGEKVHGIASAHGPVAIVTAGAFGAALLSVSVKF
jgi:Carboxypeptidase regulatory-like domain